MLEELLDGTWLDLTRIVSIVPKDRLKSYFDDTFYPPRIMVGTHDAAAFATFEFTSFQDAKDYAAALAARANAAHGRGSKVIDALEIALRAARAERPTDERGLEQLIGYVEGLKFALEIARAAR